MDFLIDRNQMPQIDDADTTALVEWLSWKKIEVTEETLPPAAVHFHQLVDWDRVRTMDEETYIKPILISSDGYVLDGNHRANAHILKGEPIKALMIDLPFMAAIRALWTFAGTYHYGDGKEHAER